MNITRKTWISAGVVGVILVGGVSVTAAAAAGRIGGGPGRGADHTPGAPADRHVTDAPAVSRTPSAPPEGATVSRQLNPEPGHVTRYWTEQRMREAKPLPMPTAEGPVEVKE